MDSSNVTVVSGIPTPEAGNSCSEKEQATLAVKVAVHVRPLIGSERLQGCKDCIIVVPGGPQVQIGNHSFTFDHVYGSTGSPSSGIFQECVAPLIDGLFRGYNATVLAYGQTGSGKTYTMGTAYTVGGSTEGVIPQVMDMMFKKVDSLKDNTEIQMRVSFIEILKEEVHDLLDPNPPASVRPEFSNGFGLKTIPCLKPSIQIRETTNGGITLAGVTEIDVSSLEEMAACLERGSLCRATASTNMNTHSSRSHAIFTITLEQKKEWDQLPVSDSTVQDDGAEDFLCAKLHLVDLAGSERAKRTGADGLRFKEGVHINKGLLALGNVISALGDEKKRKEGGHVPYRDSKLTRLLQDSLGGNSRTVMIACVSPADSNAEETLNTLKYANRARNIQNKPVVNRDPMAAEMQRMRQQLELLQAELLCVRAAAGCPDDIQIFKQKIAWLESSNEELRQQLHIYMQRAMDAQVDRDKLQLKLELLRAGKTWEEIDEGDHSQDAGLLQSYATRIQELESELCQLRESASQSFSFRHCNDISYVNGTILSDAELAEQGDSNPEEGDQTREVEEEAAKKELEHTLLQDSLDKELQDLNKRLEQKEAEMKTFVKRDNVVLKQHFERKLSELEEEKKRLQKERDALLLEMENLASATDEQTRRMQEAYQEKVKALESQICELRKKQENQAQLLRQKQQSEEASKRLQEEIHRIKTHKVQLQQKIKQESEQFRHWKASREKELLQLRKEGRRNEYVMHKLQALNQRQKLVLQRKTEEAAMATRRLKELLESRKSSLREGSLTFNGPFSQNNEKVLQQWLEHELEVAMHVHEVRSNYEKQTEARTALAKELAKLREKGDEQDNESFSVTASSLMSPNARQAKINMLETMINASSSTLVAMASQLSEAEERDRAFNGRARWQHLRTMAEAKNLLQYIFSAAAEARCQLWNKEVAMKELKEKMTELTELLRQSEAQRKEMERQQFLRDQVVTKALVTASKGGIADLSMGLPQLGGIGQRELYSNSTHNDLSIAKVNGIPYDLRKAARGLQSYNYSINEEIETEGESDMDIEEDDEGDQSDKDWTEDGDMHEGKCKGAVERGRAQKTGNKPLPPRERNSSGESVSILQEQESLGTFSSKVLCENSEFKAKSERDRCCSCSQSSGCKTKKCGCKAAGSFCGPKCGCKASKCANRESMEVEAESSTVAGEFEMEVAEAMETLRMDKAQQQLHDKCESLLGNNIVGDARVEDAKVKNRDVSHAEEILVKHGAILLQDVWKDENLPLRQRRPLSDIGNVKVDDGKPKAKQRKKWQKATVQIVPVPPHSSVPDTSNVQPAVSPLDALSNVTVTRTTVEAASAAVDSDALSKSMDESEMHSAIPWKEARSSFKLQQKISPCTSPLRTHNTHAADLAEGVGVSKRFGNGPASPRGPVRGTDEKENV